MIYEYVKDKYGHRKGVICATSRTGIGWSLCNKKDRFDKDFALMIAEGRAKKTRILFDNLKDNTELELKVPNSIVSYFDKMVDRAERYFK